MSHHTTNQSVRFENLSKKAVVAKLDQEHASSDAGAVLLKACDDKLKLSTTLAASLSDDRQQSKVTHSLEELFQQRLFAIACGYADGDNAARPRDLLRLSEALADAVIARHKRRRKRVRRITIDLDPTDDPTHGAQQLTFFNRFYDTSCYLPLAGFLTFDDEVEQYLFCYVLRAGNVAAKHGTIGVLKRLLPRLRRAFPKARLRIRLDAGFCGPELYAFFEAHKLEYVVCMAKNACLTALAEPLMAEVRSDFEAGQQTSRRYGECAYQAESWPHPRRVIVKAEVTTHVGRPPKDNPRFVVTNLKSTPQHVYEAVYCARGDVENRLKELKLGLEIDRTSCTRFLANQFRVLMSAAAYVLMQELRLRARRTGCARAQVSTLRLRLLKLGAWVESSVRRLVIHLPIGTPFADDWCRIARSVGAVVT